MLELVAKAVVPNEYLKAVFQPSITFIKENQFYSDIVSTLEQHEIDSNIPQSERMDMFIKCIGSRISLDESKQICGGKETFSVLKRKFGFRCEGSRRKRTTSSGKCETPRI